MSISIEIQNSNKLDLHLSYRIFVCLNYFSPGLVFLIKVIYIHAYEHWLNSNFFLHLLISIEFTNSIFFIYLRFFFLFFLMNL